MAYSNHSPVGEKFHLTLHMNEGTLWCGHALRTVQVYEIMDTVGET